jgi:hypothetical protein
MPNCPKVTVRPRRASRDESGSGTAVHRKLGVVREPQLDTGDTDFEREVAFELLVATARLWRSLGHHDSSGSAASTGGHLMPATPAARRSGH